VKKYYLFIIIFFFSLLVNAKGSGKIIYKYKKFEKFDFENFSIDGGIGSPGDLSINPRLSRNFKNKLPYRKNFNDKIRKSIESIR